MSDMDYDDWTDADWKAEFAEPTVPLIKRQDDELDALRSELAFANTEISRLNNELLEIGDVRREFAEAREWNGAVHKAMTDWFTCPPELLDEPLRDKVFRELWERKP